MATINTFRDLQVWQKGHSLVLEIYKVTGKFPAHEMYGIVSQMRRAILSVTCNIVEGFKRRSVHDSVHFYNIAQGSLEELKYQLVVCRDLRYISEHEYQQLSGMAEEASKMLQSWIKSQLRNSKKQ